MIINELYSTFQKKLTNTDKKILHYINNNIYQLDHLNIHELAKQIGVSHPSIIRLCKKLGFNGYSGFKSYTNHQMKTLGHNLTISQYTKLLTSSNLENIHQTIKESDSILIYCDQNMTTVGSYLKNSLHAINVPAFVLVGTHESMNLLSTIDRNVTIIIFTNDILKPSKYFFDYIALYNLKYIIITPSSVNNITIDLPNIKLPLVTNTNESSYLSYLSFYIFIDVLVTMCKV